MRIYSIGKFGSIEICILSFWLQKQWKTKIIAFMKLWLKYLIGIGAGLVLAILIPPSSMQSRAVLDFIVEFVIRFGRYTVVPVLFFSVAVAGFKLRDEKLLFRTFRWTILVILASTFALMLLGLVSALIIKLPRIPITTEKVGEISPFTWKTLITKIFPYSGFEAMVDGIYLFPCFVFAFLAGAGSASDKNASKTAIGLFDSLSKVFYIVMTFFTEILAVGMIALMFRWTIEFLATLRTGVYNGLVVMLFVELLVIAFVIYPLVLRLLCHEMHPYRILYASICPFLVAFFSGDTNLALGLHLRHGKESLGIRRRVNAFTYPLFSIFARGGSALVTTISFVLIWRSYSSLSLPVSDILWIFGISFGLSFLLGGFPSGGAFILLTILCTQYAKGFETSFLLLQPASLIICSFASLFDAITAMFGSYIVAVKTKLIEHHSITHFI